MASTDPQSLLSSANVNCYNNFGLEDQQLVKLGLLQIIAKALNPVAATDPQSLLSSANVNCYRSFGSYPLLELALLQIIANNIGSGGGGSGNVISGSAANPNTAGILPASTTTGGIYTQDPNLGTGTNVWIWSTSAQVWDQYSV